MAPAVSPCLDVGSGLAKDSRYRRRRFAASKSETASNEPTNNIRCRADARDFVNVPMGESVADAAGYSLSHSSSSAKSAALCQRASGFFARQRLTRRSRAGGTGLRRGEPGRL